jgi:hypothetical protein
VFIFGYYTTAGKKSKHSLQKTGKYATLAGGDYL